uniref:Uncharacterized protein n=1 Tax=Anguilla anguilla TaxID=7936 RepID=A0A0E9WQR5_ANGAN
MATQRILFFYCFSQNPIMKLKSIIQSFRIFYKRKYSVCIHFKKFNFFGFISIFFRFIYIRGISPTMFLINLPQTSRLFAEKETSPHFH